MTRSSKAKVLTLGAVLAASAGYVAGILTAPKSGKETRQDLASGANSVRAKADRQLKKLSGDLGELIKQGEAQSKKVKSRVSKEYVEALEQAKIAQSKAKLLISAVRSGEVDDPHLQAVIEEAKLAKANLARFLKK